MVTLWEVQALESIPSQWRKKQFQNLKTRSLLSKREWTNGISNLTNICYTYSNYMGFLVWLCVIFSVHYLLQFNLFLELYFTGQVLHTVTCEDLFSFISSLVLECEETAAESFSLPVASLLCDCSQPSMCCSPVGEMGLYSVTLPLLVYALESFLGQTQFAESGGGCDKSAIFSWSAPWSD